jgi:hypothetical protein
MPATTLLSCSSRGWCDRSDHLFRVSCPSELVDREDQYAGWDVVPSRGAPPGRLAPLFDLLRRRGVVALLDRFPDPEGDGLAADADLRVAGDEAPSLERLQQGVHEAERPGDRGPSHADVQQGDPAGLVRPRTSRGEPGLVRRRPLESRAGGAHAWVKGRDSLGHVDAMLGLLLTRHVGQDVGWNCWGARRLDGVSSNRDRRRHASRCRRKG